MDPRFGTMADLEELIAEACKRNIGLMFDMVLGKIIRIHAKAMPEDTMSSGIFRSRLGL